MSKIAFCWFWDRASQIISDWRDGYTAAVEEIGKTHDVDVFLDEKIPSPDDPYDFIWVWCDPNSSVLPKLAPYPCRKGVSLTTMPQDVSNLRGMDVVYCESKPVLEVVKSHGLRGILAFGTDTEFYTPSGDDKDIEYFYPATFSPWKRQDELAFLGDKILMVGTIQPDGQEIYEKCKAAGCRIETGYFPAKHIRDLYRRTKKMIIPAIHGSERTMLEAMACGIVPEITHPDVNFKTASYLKEFGESGINDPRNFIVSRYSHIKFAEAIMKGVES